MTDRFPAQLNTFYDVEQGSNGWHELRRGMVTASTIGALITPKTVKVSQSQTARSKLIELASERIAGRVESTPTTWQMERGNIEEDRARDLYAETYSPVTQVGFMVRKHDDALVGFSPDGLVGDDGFVEFKSRSPKIHVQHVLNDEVPPENLAQVMTGLFVTGRSWCDYTSFSNGLELWTKRVYPDLNWFAAISTAITTAETTITQIVNNYQEAVQGLPKSEYIEPFEELNITF